VRQLWRSPTLRTIVVYGAAGAGFAGANLILARVLSTEQYALFTLYFALGNIGYYLAPIGIDSVVNRRHLDTSPRLLGRVAAATGIIGLVLTAIGYFGYALPAPIALMLFLTVTAGGAMLVAGAKFQSEQRFAISLSLNQSPNVVLLLAALVVAIFDLGRASVAILISSIGFLVAATYGWTRLLRERRHTPRGSSTFSWTEALSFAGFEVSGLMLIQLERLVIPHVLPLNDLATFGVLAAIAGSLFRVIQNGVGFTLLPRLRAATSVQRRRELIAHEAWLIGAMALLGSAFIWIVTPFIEHWFLAGKYHLSGALVLAALVSGVVKIVNAFTKSTVSALATRRELATVNLLGWASVALAVGAAILGARWGLAGVIYGVALGWLARALVALAAVVKYLRVPASVPMTAP
jgi:O-antigen/teichoic acid export membrane protein